MVYTILNRKNVFNGRTYKDDPAIFGWELINEPRNYADSSGRTLQAWIDEMSAYVKSIDKRHLLTVGSEGFFGRSSDQYKQDITGSWSLSTGNTSFC
eukprot:6769387-Pyramimonas_sp.AAC.2